VRIVLVVVLVALGLLGGAVDAQQAAPAAAAPPADGGLRDLLKPFAALAAGLGMAIAAGLCGLGQAKAIAAALEGMARQPSAAGRIQVAMIIGLALIESLAIYMLVIAFILVGL
jgi:F-type H+-transporting ATPase subunit c